MNMLQLFTPGDVIYGFCQGAFGRDDYETKTCILVQPKYAVFQYESGFATVLNLNDVNMKAADVAKWKIPA